MSEVGFTPYQKERYERLQGACAEQGRDAVIAEARANLAAAHRRYAGMDAYSRLEVDGFAVALHAVEEG